MRYVFLVGVGRSGTSLLQSMLHAHPSIVFLPESHFFRRYVARSLHQRRYEKAGIIEFMTVLKEDQDFRRVNLSVEEVLAPFITGSQPFDLAEVYARMLQLYSNRKNGTLVGEKDPRLIDYLPQVKKVFPEARIIHIVRDPRDVVLSRMRADWSAGRPSWLHALTYRAQIIRGRRHGQRWFGSQYLEVRYEDLLSDPEEVLRRVADHVGVVYSSSMLAFQKSAKELIDETERAWKEETTGPLLRNNTNKWRSGLSAWQVRFTEKVCDKAFRWFGYDPAGPAFKVNPIQRFVLWMSPIFGGCFEYLYAVTSRFR